jgi:ribosome-binding protein aMBF1 (putative translation factor)
MESQPEDIQARFKRMVLLIGEYGLQHLPAKCVRHLERRVWELRLKGKDGIACALYVTASGQRVVVVRVFTKKTQKTPRKEIELALTGRGGHMSKSTKKLRKFIPVEEAFARWQKNPKFRRAYGELEEEFALVTEIIKARAKAGLTQEQLAKRMKTSQAVVARLESGRALPSTRTLKRFAKTTGHRLKITFEPEPVR